MGNFLQILKDKRVAIPAVIIIILGVAFVLFSFSSGNLNNTATKTKDNTNILINPKQDFRTTGTVNVIQDKRETTPLPEISDTTTPPVNVTKSDSDFLTVPSWVVNDNYVYTFYYPSNWKIESNLFTQGQTMVVKPLALPDTEYVPGLIINIQLTNPSASTSASKELVYQGLGYQTNSAMLDEKQWVVMTGIFPPLQNSPLPSGSYAYETQYYLDYKGISFQLIYKYPGTSKNRGYELLFQKMLSTFHIKA